MNWCKLSIFYDLGAHLIKEIDFDGKETVYHYNENSGQLATSTEVPSAYGQDFKDRIQNEFLGILKIKNF